MVDTAATAIELLVVANIVVSPERLATIQYTEAEFVLAVVGEEPRVVSAIQETSLRIFAA